MSLVKRFVEAGTGLTQMTQERAEAVVRELAHIGEVQADEAQTTVKELVDRSREGTERLAELVRQEVARQLAAIGVATRRDVDGLATRVDRMEELLSLDVFDAEVHAHQAQERAEEVAADVARLSAVAAAPARTAKARAAKAPAKRAAKAPARAAKAPARAAKAPARAAKAPARAAKAPARAAKAPAKRAAATASTTPQEASAVRRAFAGARDAGDEPDAGETPDGPIA